MTQFSSYRFGQQQPAFRVMAFWFVMAAMTLVTATLPDHLAEFEIEEIELADKSESESKEAEKLFEKDVFNQGLESSAWTGASFLCSHDASIIFWNSPSLEVITPPPEA